MTDSPLLDAALLATLFASVGLIWVVILTRIVGLRSFSKMTAFDFVTTVAIGSLLANAGVASDAEAFVRTLTAIAALLAVQFASSLLRRHSDGFRRLIDNQPRVLMRDGVIDERALDAARVAEADVIAKLREANALSMDGVAAVVLEATGDISVLHGGDVDSRLLESVR